MKYFLLGILIMANTTISAQDKPTLIYIGDPMCSWCYGFGNEIAAVIDDLGEEIQLEVVMGGLRPYNTQTMTDLKEFLTEHWHEVNRASQQPFSYEILDTDLLYDTEPACRAVIVARELQPKSTMHFFHKVQNAFYHENKNPHLTATYADIAEQMGMDRNLFIKKFESEKYKKLIKEDFLRASQLGVRSFPTVLLVSDGNTKIVSAGYSKAEEVLSKVKKIISKK